MNKWARQNNNKRNRRNINTEGSNTLNPWDLMQYHENTNRVMKEQINEWNSRNPNGAEIKWVKFPASVSHGGRILTTVQRQQGRNISKTHNVVHVKHLKAAQPTTTNCRAAAASCQQHISTSCRTRTARADWKVHDPKQKQTTRTASASCTCSSTLWVIMYKV